MIVRGGSGSGINLSNIRGSMEPLAKGGTASGPVSFMRGADAWAGTIKSGGKTRRAAKMVVLDVDHPDIRSFIRCKADEEEKAAALREAGFDMRIDGEGFHSIQYQNANNSVRVSDDFMRAVEADGEWRLIARTTGEPVGDPIPARELMREISEAAWRCADPGVQYDTTINQWHTSPNSGRGTAAAITALMTGRAYLGSARIAAGIGPYERYGENRDAHNDVMRMHRDASYAIPDAVCADAGLLEAARTTWDEAVAVGELYGYRNAQATVLAPTGTISFLMDCDTTGVEPDFSLVKFKVLVGGGQVQIVNRTVPRALDL